LKCFDRRCCIPPCFRAVENITNQALEWNHQGKRKKGRPKNSWRRGIISELQAINTTWGEAKRKAQDRTRYDHLTPMIVLMERFRKT
jgi:hypothetical protein